MKDVIASRVKVFLSEHNFSGNLTFIFSDKIALSVGENGEYFCILGSKKSFENVFARKYSTKLWKVGLKFPQNGNSDKISLSIGKITLDFGK